MWEESKEPVIAGRRVYGLSARFKGHFSLERTVRTAGCKAHGKEWYEHRVG